MYQKFAAETRVFILSFASKLNADELLTGTPSVSVYPAGPTLGTPTVTTIEETVNGRKVAAGMAVKFSVAGGTAGTNYTIKATCSTDATPAQTLIDSINFRVN